MTTKTARSRTKKPARGDQPQRLTESPADAGLPVAGESLPGQKSLPMASRSERVRRSEAARVRLVEG